jgi:uncharacterized protein (DUF927 family)
MTSIITPQEAYALGWSVIPCNQKKVCLLTSWKTYQTRLPTTEEFETWAKVNAPAWAIITGAVSKRITLDFDGEAGRQTFEKLKIPAHRSTPSGGYHIDFAHPGWRISSLNGKTKIELSKRWPGMDIRADGGYVLFYGKTDRGTYTWLREPEPHPLELLPHELQAFLGVHWIEPNVDEIIRIALGRIPSEGRNAAGFWLATQLRDNRFEQDRALAAMHVFRSMCPSVNHKGEQEEYTEAEVRASLDSAFSKSARKPWPTAKINGSAPEIEVPARGSARGRPSHPKESPQRPKVTAPVSAPHFEVTEVGVFYIDQTTGWPTEICRPPLYVTAYARDENSDAWGRQLKWKDLKDKSHSWTMPMRALIGDATTVRETLADGGLIISTNPKTKHLLDQYLRTQNPERYIHCVPHIGWFGHTFVFPEDTVPEDADVVFQSEAQEQHTYRSRGTLESWQTEVSIKCVGNSRLIFAISASFAGALLAPLNMQGGGFHFRSFSSLGKSTTQYVAGSVWGGGGRHGHVRSWSSTKAALEWMAELHNHATLILDEIRQIDQRDVEPIIYMLANGLGRARQTKSLTGRRTLEWLLLVLSSGEIKLSEVAALAGQKIKAGAEIRMATIPADAAKGMGVFEQLNGTDNPRIFAQTLEAAAKQNYGTAIRPFLKYWIENWEAETESSKQYMEQFFEDNFPKDENAGAEVGRVLNRIALVACAGEIATDAGITGWQSGEAEAAAKQCFEAYLEERGGVGSIDIQNAISSIHETFASSQGRFYPADPKPDEIVRPIQDSLGYWKIIDEKLVFLVDQNKFRNELCKGTGDYKDIYKELQRRRLSPASDGKNLGHKYDITLLSGVRKRLRFLAIKAEVLEA